MSNSDDTDRALILLDTYAPAGAWVLSHGLLGQVWVTVDAESIVDLPTLQRVTMGL